MEDVLKNLETLGFTNYESRVFYALFQSGLSTASDIAKSAKIPRSSAYDILKSFSTKGICNEIQTSSIVKYELIDPQIVQDKIRKDIKDTYTTKITNLDSSFERLQPLFRSRGMDPEKVDVELIKGFNKRRNAKFLELMRNSRYEMLLMNKLEGFSYQELDQTSLDLYARGGKILSIYQFSPNFRIKFDNVWKDCSPEDLIKLCDRFIEQGEQVRLSDNVPQNVAIFDRKVVFISLVDPTIPKYNRSDIIVKNENFAEFIVQNFNFCWEKSKTVEEYREQLLKNSKP